MRVKNEFPDFKKSMIPKEVSPEPDYEEELGIVVNSVEDGASKDPDWDFDEYE